MIASVAPNELVGHGIEREHQNPRPFKTRKGRPPGKAKPITQRRRTGVISSQRVRSSIGKSRKGWPPAVISSWQGTGRAYLCTCKSGLIAVEKVPNLKLWCFF